MDDLPTFDRPRNATSGLPSRGHCERSKTLLTNFALVTFMRGVGCQVSVGDFYPTPDLRHPTSAYAFAASAPACSPAAAARACAMRRIISRMRVMRSSMLGIAMTAFSRCCM
jgi:hypothetical protein